MSQQVFHFDRSRMFRSLIGLLPLAGFPIVLHMLGHGDPAFFVFFGGVAVALIGGVVYTALRFKLSIDSSGLTCRGRINKRRIEFDSLSAVVLRTGRDKATRFMGPPPFRELVLQTGTKKLVISSLPLGEDAFDSILEAVSKHVDIALESSSN